jgi:hypothetical protein
MTRDVRPPLQVAAGIGEQLRAQGGSEAGHAGDAGGVRVGLEAFLDVFVEVFELAVQGQQLRGQPGDQRRSTASVGSATVCCLTAARALSTIDQPTLPKERPEIRATFAADNDTGYRSPPVP